MKKSITLLLLFVGAVTTSFAQYGHDNNHDHDQYSNSSTGHNDNWRDRRSDDNGNFYSGRDRDFQIEKINRDFNFQVQSIQNDPYMRHREKKVAIRNAERERVRQIEMVNERFNGRFHGGRDRHDDDGR